MTKIRKLGLVAATMLLLSASAYAQTTNYIISVNFPGAGWNFNGVADPPLDTSWVVGATNYPVAVSNWFNTVNFEDGSLANGITMATWDCYSNATDVQLKYVGNDSWNGNGPPNADNQSPTYDELMMKGAIKRMDSFQYQNLSTNTSYTYDIYIYGDSDAGGGITTTVIGTGITNYWDTTSYYSSADGWIESTNTLGTPLQFGDFIRIPGVHATNGLITIGFDRSGDPGIAAIQIVSTNPFPHVGLPVSLTASPADATTVAGTSVAFVAAAQNPGVWQWYSNSVAILNETNATYTTPPLQVSASGSKFKAIYTGPVNAVTTTVATVTVIPDSGTRASMSFSETAGAVTTSRGDFYGLGTFALQGGYPAFSANVPAGPYAPNASDNLSSLDFGPIVNSTDGGRAVDFFTNAPFTSAGAFNAVTICGWLNVYDLTTAGGSGDRILNALTGTQGGNGFDMGLYNDGHIGFGINELNNSSTPSSAGKVTADPTASAANWVFFAVTYDGTQTANNLSYYFGSPTAPAALDVTVTYDRGPVFGSGMMTLGNYNLNDSRRTSLGTGGSRNLRGIMDEVRVFDTALSLNDLLVAQTNTPFKPALSEPVITQQPASINSAPNQNNVVFSVLFSGTAPFTIQWKTNGVSVPGATNALFDFASFSPFGVVTTDDTNVVVTVGITNYLGGVLSAPAKLQVLDATTTTNLVQLSLGEGSGTVTINTGDLQGAASFITSDGFPLWTTNVPLGPYAPTNNAFAIDLGNLYNPSGPLAADLYPFVSFSGLMDGTLGALNAFTASAWINLRDTSSQKRILFALNQDGGDGFDFGMANGVLQLGVNQYMAGPSTASILPTSATADPTNWVFVAVVYDGMAGAGGQVSYYFGTPTQLATNVDISTTPGIGVADYPQGVIGQSGPLTLGNVGPRSGARDDHSLGSRELRGLIDEAHVVAAALSLADVQALQTAPAAVVTRPPVTLSAKLVNKQVVLSWSSTLYWHLQKASSVTSGVWGPETTAPVVNGTTYTVTVPATGTNQFYRLVSP